MKGGAWPSTVHGVAKNQTQLSDSHTYIGAFHEFQLAWRVVKSDWNRKTEHLYCTEKGRMKEREEGKKRREKGKKRRKEGRKEKTTLFSNE